jgi:hypothetical protein
MRNHYQGQNRTPESATNCKHHELSSARISMGDGSSEATGEWIASRDQQTWRVYVRMLSSYLITVTDLIH